MEDFLENFTKFKFWLFSGDDLRSCTNNIDVEEGYQEALADIRDKFRELGLDQAF